MVRKVLVYLALIAISIGVSGCGRLQRRVSRTVEPIWEGTKEVAGKGFEAGVRGAAWAIDRENAPRPPDPLKQDRIDDFSRSLNTPWMPGPYGSVGR
jgi:hypothetical protein